MARNAMIFSGNANPELAQKISNYLSIPLGIIDVGRFSDGEVAVHVGESVRGHDVYLIQPTCPPSPADNLIELMAMIDAMRRASAARITAVIPYFGYARQDRRPHSARVPITAKLVANMLTTAGANRILTVDLHADQIQGFFDIPVDNIYGSPVKVADIKRNYTNAMVISPDVGGVVRARAVAKLLDTDLAIVDKRRPRANVAEVMNIIGSVEGRDCIIVDDMVDTAGTLCKAAAALKERGAKRVMAYVTHAILSGKALENIQSSVLDELVVTDTIPLNERSQACEKIRQLTISDMLAETIRRIHTEESVSSILPNL